MGELPGRDLERAAMFPVCLADPEQVEFVGADTRIEDEAGSDEVQGRSPGCGRGYRPRARMDAGAAATSPTGRMFHFSLERSRVCRGVLRGC